MNSLWQVYSFLEAVLAQININYLLLTSQNLRTVAMT